MTLMPSNDRAALDGKGGHGISAKAPFKTARLSRQRGSQQRQYAHDGLRVAKKQSLRTDRR